MLSVQPRRRCQCDEKLGAVGVGAGVGHAENASAGVLQRWRNFVFELLAVYGFAASTGTSRIATLNHEVWNDAVEDKTVEVVALCERSEVFACLGRMVVVEFDRDEALGSSAIAARGSAHNIRQ